MLAEFKYGLEPQESFSNVFGDQAIPRSAFYYLKKDFFPYVYWNYMVRELILLLLVNTADIAFARSRALGSARRASAAPPSASKCIML